MRLTRSTCGSSYLQSLVTTQPNVGVSNVTFEPGVAITGIHQWFSDFTRYLARLVSGETSSKPTAGDVM